MGLPIWSDRLPPGSHGLEGLATWYRPAGRMNASTADHAGRGFKERIGWKRLGIAASLLIIAFAITTLVRTLKGVDTGVILIALTEIPPAHIALAALCVLGAFCTLTFYDFFALRTIGKKHVPYRIAALSSFTSYSIGHNIGATVFTGGAIRFRIYSDYGLNAIDVAKICFLSGLTFWLGNTVRARHRHGLASLGGVARWICCRLPSTG